MTRRPLTTENRVDLRTIISAGMLAVLVLVLVLACAGTVAGADMQIAEAAA